MLVSLQQLLSLEVQYDDLYLYEEGSGYGSDILNLEKPVNITRKVGKDAELKPIISNGSISFVEIQSKGQELSICT